MSEAPRERLLIADDEAAILAEYERVFQAAPAASAVRELESELFGDKPTLPAVRFAVHTVTQGEQAIAAVEQALRDGQPYPVVFLDVRMPPGLNGVETARAIRALDPDVHIVIITGYSDMSPEEIVAEVQPPDRLFYFEKPFRAIELRQLASALTAKWHAERTLAAARDDLEDKVAQRTAELEKATRAAEQASQSKTTFLANMSHELRTPLNAVIGFSEFMLDEPLGPLGHERYREYMNDIKESGDHLLSLINAILEIAKADSGKLMLHEQSFAVIEAVEAASRLVHPQAAKGGVTLAQDIAVPGCPIRADKTKVVQILVNLLSNAVKFTPAGGRVDLRTNLDAEGALRIVVADTGIGIRKDDIPRALELFSQINDRRDRPYDGTGLGLPLSLALVELHGGTLALESEVGVGTTVTVTFPPERIRRGADERLARTA